MRSCDGRLFDTAAQQFGVFSREQALAAGATPRLITSRLASGSWRLEAPNVYGLPGHRSSWRRRLWTAYLGAGANACVGFQAAGRVHGLSGVPEGRPTLIVDRPRRHAPDGVVWHRLDDLEPTHVHLRNGLRVTTPARTLVDLAVVFGRGRLSHVVEDAIVKGLVDVASVGSVLGRVRRRGKPGVARLGDVLDLLGPGSGVPHSELERLLDRAIVLSGLPSPTHEHPLPSVQCLDGFVDRCFAGARLIVEADGRKWHERRRNMARDAERDIEAARGGFQTVRLMWEHLTSDPQGMAASLVDIHRVRLHC